MSRNASLRCAMSQSEWSMRDESKRVDCDCAIPRISYVARASIDVEVIYYLAGCRFRFFCSSPLCWPWLNTYTLLGTVCSTRAIPNLAMQSTSDCTISGRTVDTVQTAVIPTVTVIKPVITSHHPLDLYQRCYCWHFLVFVTQNCG